MRHSPLSTLPSARMGKGKTRGGEMSGRKGPRGLSQRAKPKLVKMSWESFQEVEGHHCLSGW